MRPSVEDDAAHERLAHPIAQDRQVSGVIRRRGGAGLDLDRDDAAAPELCRSLWYRFAACISTSLPHLALSLGREDDATASGLCAQARPDRDRYSRTDRAKARPMSTASSRSFVPNGLS